MWECIAEDSSIFITFAPSLINVLMNHPHCLLQCRPWHTPRLSRKGFLISLSNCFARLISHATNDISSARRWSNVSHRWKTQPTLLLPVRVPIRGNPDCIALQSRAGCTGIHGRVNAGNVRPGKTRKSGRYRCYRVSVKRKCGVTYNSPTVIIVRARIICAWCIDLLRIARVARREKSISSAERKSQRSRILKHQQELQTETYK